MQGARVAVALLVTFGLLQALFLVSCASAADAGAGGVDADMASHKRSGTADDTLAAEAEAMSYDGFNAAEREAMESSKDNFEFQAEVGRLMDIIINSLYSKKEIFLRELISNASDALDKIRFLSVSDPKALGEGETRDLEIFIEADKDLNSISITDRGIGMTKEQLIANLGTIAKSGTSQFLEQMKSGSDMNLIGQFGVGFYSVYLVADQVTVTTKHNDDKQYVWTSQADSSFTIAEDPRGDTLGRGTRITLRLKKDSAEFLEEDTLKGLIKKYSEFINFPINLKVTKEVEVEVPVEESEEKTEGEGEDTKEESGEGEDKKDDEDVEVSDADSEGEDTKPKTKKVKEKKTEWERINDTKALWMRSPEDIKESEYNGFFKAITKEFEDPMQKIHFKAEGEIEFASILFVPKKAPNDMFEKLQSKAQNLKLFVRRVFITDEFDDLIPRYLSFIRGIVDSEDLPLNVSREMLQQSRVLKVIKKKLVSKVLEMFKKLSEAEEKAVAAESEKDAEEEEAEKKAAAGEKEEDTEEGEGEGEEEEEEEEGGEAAIKLYRDFHEQYGKALKLGVIEDSKNRKKLSKLLRFESTHTKGDETVSLARYVDRMKEGQKHIYYIAGAKKSEVEKSPFLEKLKKRGFEVLYMTDPIDEYALQHMDEYDDHKLMNAAKEDLKFGDKEEKRENKRREKAKEELKDFTKWYKDLLSDQVEKIVMSNRLTSTPLTVVTGTYGYTANMERLMKAQALNDPSKYQFMASKKTLELNPYHPIVLELAKRVADTPDDEETKALARMMWDSALIQSGFDVQDTNEFSNSVMGMLKKNLNLDADATAPEEEPEVELDEEKESSDSSEEEEKESEADDDSDDKKEEL